MLSFTALESYLSSLVKLLCNHLIGATSDRTYVEIVACLCCSHEVLSD
jgi:hypothetical protein